MFDTGIERDNFFEGLVDAYTRYLPMDGALPDGNIRFGAVVGQDIELDYSNWVALGRPEYIAVTYEATTESAFDIMEDEDY